MKLFKSLFLTTVLASLLFSCGTSAILSTPIENIDTTPLKTADLTEYEKQTWCHLDLVKDTIPGMSVEKAYAEIIQDKKGKKVIVAVVDSGIDIDHEDLNDVVWTNKKEVPNNGKDDDKNGYVDDVHGWNFLGDGYDEQLEFVRIIVKGDKSNPQYEAAKAEYDTKYQQALGNKTRYDQIYQGVKGADDAIAKHLNKKDYTKEDVAKINTEDESLKQSVMMLNNMYLNGFDSAEAAL